MGNRIVLAGLIAAAAVLGLSVPAGATPADLSVTRQAGLEFGSFVVINQGSVTVTPNGTVERVNAVAVSGASPTAARFQVTGEPGAQVRVRIPLGPDAVSGSGLTATFGRYTVETDLGPVPPGALAGGEFDMTLSPTGVRTIYIGGTVDVSRSTGSGSVSANIGIEVTYLP